MDPVAYFALDRMALNRRKAKSDKAKMGLDKIVNAAKDGAKKGMKAKRQRNS